MSTGASSPLQQQPPPPSQDSSLRLLDVLKLLVDTRKATTTKDLIRYAQQSGANDVVERLQHLYEENVPLALAFDAVSVHLRLQAHRRSSALVQSCRGKKAALILPVPPHVLTLLQPVCGEIRMLLPAEMHLAGFFEPFAAQIIHGARACRAALAGCDMIVIEACREDGKWFCESGAAELVEPGRLGESVRVLAHLRPHKNPEDVELPLDPQKVHVL
jgi:hypothetical protein